VAQCGAFVEEKMKIVVYYTAGSEEAAVNGSNSESGTWLPGRGFKPLEYPDDLAPADLAPEHQLEFDADTCVEDIMEEEGDEVVQRARGVAKFLLWHEFSCKGEAVEQEWTAQNIYSGDVDFMLAIGETCTSLSLRALPADDEAKAAWWIVLFCLQHDNHLVKIAPLERFAHVDTE